MKGRQSLKSKETPRDRAWSAMGLLGWSITWNDRTGEIEDADTVRMGMEAMASALVEWKDLELAAAPLDEVLAELGLEDDLVETAAELNDLLGRIDYDGAIGEEHVDTAERLREELVEALDDLVQGFEREEGSNA